MAISTTFIWFPDTEGDLDQKTTVKKVNFGDGYELRVAEGINTKPMTWNLTFTRGSVEANQILAFLRARGGLEAFRWTNPLSEDGVYVCDGWKGKRLKGGDGLIITASFRQIFEY